MWEYYCITFFLFCKRKNMENCGGGKPPPYDMLTRFAVIFWATSESPLLSHSLFHFTLDIAVGFLFGGDIAFIVKFFAFTKPNLHLCPSFFEIDG